MRLAILTAIILTIAYLAFNCSRRSTIINDAEHRASGVPSPTSIQSSVEDLRMKNNVESLSEQIAAALKAESVKLGLDNLKDSPAVPGTEVRILVGFGLAYPRCFILTNINGNNRGSFITARIKNDRAEMDQQGGILSKNVALPAPSSGWNIFEQFLKNQGVESPLKLSPDDTPSLDPDEEIITIEAKSGSVYSMVFFASSTQSEDGKKAWGVWERIKREFDVRNRT